MKKQELEKLQTEKLQAERTAEKNKSSDAGKQKRVTKGKRQGNQAGEIKE